MGLSVDPPKKTGRKSVKPHMKYRTMINKSKKISVRRNVLKRSPKLKQKRKISAKTRYSVKNRKSGGKNISSRKRSAGKIAKEKRCRGSLNRKPKPIIVPKPVTPFINRLRKLRKESEKLKTLQKGSTKKGKRLTQSGKNGAHGSKTSEIASS